MGEKGNKQPLLYAVKQALFIGLNFFDDQVDAEAAQTMELTMQAKKAVASKRELSSKLMAEDSILGVGVTGTAAEPEVILYVQDGAATPKMETSGIKFQAEGAEYNGMRTRIVKTDRIRAFEWNENLSVGQSCHC